MPALAFPLLFALAQPARGGDRRPDVILVSVDDLRADRVRPDLAPNLSRLAARSVSFEQAVSAATWTLPSHASMLTGLLPRRHEAGGSTASPRAMRPGARTLARWFKDAGYATAGFYNGPFLSPRFGFGDGCDLYRHDRIPRTFADAARWALARKAEGRPFFLFVHTFDVHRYPRLDEKLGFDPSREYPRVEADPSEADCAAARRRYDAAVRSFDRDLGAFLDALGNHGALEGAVVAVVADHGETLCEPHPTGRALGHGLLPYDESIRVPWVLKLPGGRLAGTRVTAPASLVDLAPTLAAAARIAGGRGLDGVARLSDEGVAGSTADVVVEADDWAALRGGGRKTLVFKDGRALSFDLADDPAETAASGRAVPGKDLERLRRRLAEPLPASRGRPTKALLEALRASGYRP